MGNKEFECSAVLNGIEIELTNYCGLDCFGCIRKQSKSFGYLDFEILKKIIEFIKNKAYQEIVLSGLGDVFLHKNLYKFIDYIFEKLPNIKVYIMTKGQSIKDKDLKKFLNYKKKGFNIGLTYSIFSLNKEEYREVTGGGDLNKLLEIIKSSYNKQINFSFEFLLNKNNIRYVSNFKKFCNIFHKDFFYSIPHNWGGNLDKKEYNETFGEKELLDFLEKRQKNEQCEAFKGNYLFFDYLGNIYKCGLKRFSNDLYLGNIKNIGDLGGNIKKLGYRKCSNCSYFNYKTKM